MHLAIRVIFPNNISASEGHRSVIMSLKLTSTVELVGSQDTFKALKA